MVKLVVFVQLKTPMNVGQQDLSLTVKSTLLCPFHGLLVWRFYSWLFFPNLNCNILTLLVLYSWSAHLFILQINVSVVVHFFIDLLNLQIRKVHLLYFPWTLLELCIQSRVIGQCNIMRVTPIRELRAFRHLRPVNEAFLFATKGVFIHVITYCIIDMGADNYNSNRTHESGQLPYPTG